MLPTSWYAIGFVVYLFFCIITFETYSQKNGGPSPYALFGIYLFYSALAVYWILIVDTLGTPMEIIIQSLVYTVAVGFVLFFHYKNTLLNREDVFSKSSRL